MVGRPSLDLQLVRVRRWKLNLAPPCMIAEPANSMQCCCAKVAAIEMSLQHQGAPVVSRQAGITNLIRHLPFHLRSLGLIMAALQRDGATLLYSMRVLLLLSFPSLSLFFLFP